MTALTIPFNEIRSWMFDDALPFWGSAGVDEARGGYFEELDFAGRPTGVTFKRTRVICRQVYAFSHASLLGWRAGEALAARGYDYLVRHAWLGAGQGWARRLTATGAVLDPTPDLYDLAFVIFALAWRFKASGDPDALRRMHETLDFVEKRMRPAEGIGFLHERPAHGFRVQNPHMHLLEACLTAFEATEAERFLERAREVVGLFRTYFFDGRTLAEYFTDGWRRDPGPAGAVVEPGHQYEWAWILASYERLSGSPARDAAEALVAFAEQHGVDPVTMATFNQVRADGAPLDRGSRTWPNTERIKGHLALFELVSRNPRRAVAESARLLLDRYLAVTPRGLWMDLFDASGQPASAAVPTSTLYHVFLAFAEVLRLEPQIADLGLSGRSRPA